MTGRLLHHHHHTADVQTRHSTSSISTPTVDTTVERAFGVDVCELMHSASLPPSACRRSHCRCCRCLRVDSQQNLFLPKIHRRQIIFAKVRVHIGWGRNMDRVGACCTYVGKTEFWLRQYERKKPLERHTRLQDNMKTGLKDMGCESVD